MRRVWFVFAVCGILAGVASAQASNSAPPAAPEYENGSLANNSYSNECFGFSIPIPDGWQSNPVSPDGRAKHLPGGGIALLVVRQPQPAPATGNTIILTARDTMGSAPTVKEFVSATVHSQVNADKEHRELLRDAFPVDYAGQHFFRAEYKLSTNGQQIFSGFAYTKFRGYYIGATLVAGSAEGLEESAKALNHISFREDTPDPKCVMKGDGTRTPEIAK